MQKPKSHKMQGLKSPRISRFSLFLCFDKIAFTNSSDVTKDAKISDKGLCNTFIKLLEQSRILSNWRKQALNDHSRRNKLLRWNFKVHIRSRSSSTPIRPLSLYRPLRESHRPQGGRYRPLWLPLPQTNRRTGGTNFTWEAPLLCALTSKRS
ncbi:hypothetical protein T12_3806 [Trichinella patagoniensis]|uniref:Uncharacterized protein n=1 Tax=Trichinella patagoniensis TaxID=990121 RepID=A0A0V0ZZS1_9BILA|nr:hypothetical protein T12_3806 [Trichinella patagoniensis]